MGRLFLGLLFSWPLWALPTQQELTDRYRALDTRPAQSKTFLDRQERHELFQLVSQDAVTCLDSLCYYDPNDEVGFSFGRAMAVHLMARARGLQPDAIRKVMVIGDLRSGTDGAWRFHVATAVRSETGIWQVIDPLMEQPLGPETSVPLEEWIRVIQNNWDPKLTAHFYLLNRSVIIPDIRVVPEPDKETGAAAVELKFSPHREPGFRRKLAGRKAYYEVDSEKEHEFFVRVDEKNPEDRFSFLDVTVNARRYDFKGYFEDLFDELGEMPPVLEVPEMIQRPGMPQVESKESDKATRQLGSFKILNWFK